SSWPGSWRAGSRRSRRAIPARKTWSFTLFCRADPVPLPQRSPPAQRRASPLLACHRRIVLHFVAAPRLVAPAVVHARGWRRGLRRGGVVAAGFIADGPRLGGRRRVIARLAFGTGHGTTPWQHLG